MGAELFDDLGLFVFVEHRLSADRLSEYWDAQSPKTKMNDIKFYGEKSTGFWGKCQKGGDGPGVRCAGAECGVRGWTRPLPRAS